MESSEYEQFSDIYGIWTATAASAQANKAFYVNAYLAADGPVVELGVGDGRLAVEAARRGRDIIGVDILLPIASVILTQQVPAAEVRRRNCLRR